VKEDKNILNNLNRTEKPAVANRFFDSFSDGLIKKLEEETLLTSLSKNTKPEAPNDFFDKFADEIIAKIQSKNKFKIIPLRIFIAVASVAAVFAILILTNRDGQNQTNAIVNNSIVNSADENDDYLAYIDESILVDFIVENDIDIEEGNAINESVYSELDNELDDYYYNY